MTAVWYVGSSDRRVITSGEWFSNGGIVAPTSVWEAGNGWSLPRTGFTPAQIALLSGMGEFNVSGADGPRVPLNDGNPFTWDPSAGQGPPLDVVTHDELVVALDQYARWNDDHDGLVIDGEDVPMGSGGSGTGLVINPVTGQYSFGNAS